MQGRSTSRASRLRLINCPHSESETLEQPATNNTPEQFANSPDLKSELLNAIIGTLEPRNAMNTQALSSETVRSGIKVVLPRPARLDESVREQAVGDANEQDEYPLRKRRQSARRAALKRCRPAPCHGLHDRSGRGGILESAVVGQRSFLWSPTNVPGRQP
jgi:hypothetical protein